MKIENNVFEMQAYVNVPNIQYLHLPNLLTNFDVWSTIETTQNFVCFEQDQISLHHRELLPKYVEDRCNQEDFYP